MNLDQSTAIVLRFVEFSETSLIVTLLTRDFGRISAIAKGARRLKGPFEGALDLLSVCRVVVIRKQSDALDLLTEAKLHRRFRGGEKSLPRLYAGYAVAELLRLMIDDDQPHPDIYDLTIHVLSQLDGHGNVAANLLYFEIQLLRMLGHNPGIDTCTECGSPLQTGAASAANVAAFSLDAGGLVCPDCQVRQRQNVFVSPAVIQTLRQYASRVDGAPPMTAAVYPALRNLIDRYVQTIAGRKPRMQSFVPTTLL